MSPLARNSRTRTLTSTPVLPVPAGDHATWAGVYALVGTRLDSRDAGRWWGLGSAYWVRVLVGKSGRQRRGGGQLGSAVGCGHARGSNGEYPQVVFSQAAMSRRCEAHEVDVIEVRMGGSWLASP